MTASPEVCAKLKPATSENTPKGRVVLVDGMYAFYVDENHYRVFSFGWDSEKDKSVCMRKVPTKLLPMHLVRYENKLLCGKLSHKVDDTTYLFRIDFPEAPRPRYVTIDESDIVSDAIPYTKRSNDAMGTYIKLNRVLQTLEGSQEELMLITPGCLCIGWCDYSTQATYCCYVKPRDDGKTDVKRFETSPQASLNNTWGWYCERVAAIHPSLLPIVVVNVAADRYEVATIKGLDLTTDKILASTQDGEELSLDLAQIIYRCDELDRSHLTKIDECK